MLCSSSISNRDIIKVPSQRLLLTEGIWSSSVFSSSAFSDNSKDLDQTRTSVQLGSSGKLTDGWTDRRTDELRILRIDLLTDGYMGLTDRSTNGCYANGETADEHLLVQASKPCRPISGNFEWYETDRNSAAWMIYKRIKILRVKTECERTDYIDDRQNTIRFFLPIRWTFLRQDRNRQKQTDRITDRLTDWQTDRQGNNGKQFRD